VLFSGGKFGLMLVFEDLCSKLQGIFDRKECGLLL